MHSCLMIILFSIMKTWVLKNPFCAPLAKDKLWDDYTMAWMTVH